MWNLKKQGERVNKTNRFIVTVKRLVVAIGRDVGKWLKKLQGWGIN